MMGRRRLFPALAWVVTLLCFSDRAHAESEFKLGVEGFHDRYREPISQDILVDERSNYGSGTASYSYTRNRYFGTVEGRGSYGRDDYKSPSGLINHIPQYETEGRLLGGMKLPMNGGSVFIPYIGVGSRYFFDKNKGNVTSLGLFGYDRRILQFYMPIGAGMKIYSGDWIYSPLLEFEPLLYGSVKSRLANLPGLYNINNTQTKGYGWRGEFMVGKQYKHVGWEVGPFFRYWNIRDSDVATDPSGTQWIEPHNTRVQAGGALRVVF